MAEDGETTHLTNGDMEPSDLTNGDMEPSHLTNGDMQPEDAETHEMTDMNGKEGFEPEKGRKNEGYEGEEEAVYMPNGTTENKDPVIRADSGVEIDGTDSENNGDRGASPQNGMVDEEDGLFESFAETITGLELSLTESELTEATERGSTAASIAWNTSEDKDRHPSFVATPATEDAPSSATDVKVVSPVPTPPDYPPPPPPPQRGTEPTTKCTLRTDGDTGENTCIKESLKKPVTLDVTSEEETDSETEYDNASDLPWPKASSDSPEKHFVYVGTLDPGIDSASDNGLETDSSIGDPVDISDSSRPSTSTPIQGRRQSDPEPPTPPEMADTLNATIDEPWPAPPTPIATLEPEDNPGKDEADGIGKDEVDVKPYRSPDPPVKPRRSANSMQHDKPIMAYEIEMEQLGGNDDDENEETQLIDSQTTPEPTDPTVQVDIGDPDDDPTETADTRDPEELSLTEVETATEYENHEGGTLTGYDNATYEVETPADGLETPTYTPPDSPAEDRKYESAVNMENGDAEDKFRFVQHEGVDDETTRAESRKKFKRKTDCKCICLSILCFIVMILAAAFAFFLAMFFVGSLDGFLGREATEEGPPPQRPQGMMVEAPPIQMITTLAQISLDLDWQMAFDFPSSPERTEIQYNVIRDLDNIFRWGSTEYVYWKTEIDEFRRGPFGENVFVKFTSFFYNVPDGMITVPEGTTSPSTDELYDFAREDMSQIVFELLATAIDGGRFQSVTVERGTLELLLTEITEGTRRMTVEAPPIQMITTLAQISLDLDWQVAFDFPSSPERTEIQDNVTRDLDNIFRWGSTEYVYWKTEIDDFRRGPFGESVFVKFTSFFYNVPDGMITVPEGTTSPSTDELYEFAREDMSQIVFELLATAIDGGRFESVTVERGTLELLSTEITEGTRR
ncbi:uncharacterized protein [Amphiura filiformis]|uniref:uncharacterized protein isoform X2 n=1 Tax=Amphiura filiformis TaxID=82378 RepID=UPI003B222306